MYWQKIFWVMMLVVVVALVFIGGVVRWGWGWTGFFGNQIVAVTRDIPGSVPVASVTMEYSRRTLWDLLDILIVPLLIPAGFYWLDKQAKEREQKRQEARRREIEVDRQRDAELKNYLDKMAAILSEPGGREAMRNSAGRDIARVQTYLILRRLDGIRKGQIVSFLYEAGLIEAIGDEGPLLDLWGADLRGTYLVSATLRGISLGKVNLHQANLCYCDLAKANLADVDFFKADLQGASLRGANLRGANLNEADLSNANLSEADLQGASLRGANLRGANLNEADLSNANLSEANLIEADLDDANLNGVRYDKRTLWPEGFEPKVMGAVQEE